LEPICGNDIFKTSLNANDERFLREIFESTTKEIERGLQSGDFKKVQI
jgi:hypothetical protein